MIQPGDPRIKKNTKEREDYYNRNPSDKTDGWKNNLSEDQINELEKTNKK